MSLVATGGGLIFGGDTVGHFLALDQDSGKVLWEINLGSPVTGYPITYSVNGKQYVAVSTGNSLVSSGLNTLAPELHPSNASNIFAFALPLLSWLIGYDSEYAIRNTGSSRARQQAEFESWTLYF